MDRIGEFLRHHDSAKAGNKEGSQVYVRQTLDRLDQAGFRNPKVITAKQTLLAISGVFNGRVWRALLIPTFHGLQVSVVGQDVGGAKAYIDRIIKTVFDNQL